MLRKIGKGLRWAGDKIDPPPVTWRIISGSNWMYPEVRGNKDAGLDEWIWRPKYPPVEPELVILAGGSRWFEYNWPD